MGCRRRDDIGTDVRRMPANVTRSRDDVVDFEVEGVVRVRTHGGGPTDLAALRRDVGDPVRTTAQPIEVTVHFVDEVPHADVRLLDGGSMGYGDDGVYFFPRFGQAPIARVSQGGSWGEACIVCRRGVGRIPSLSSAVDLAALSRGWAPVHGSAWVTPEGVGVLVSGWARSGKTGALLAACEGGAIPVGDDRILIAGDGSSMMGLGRPVEVKDWHLARLRLPAAGRRTVRRILAYGSSALNVPFERARRALSVELDLADLAGGTGVASSARPDVLVILETHRSPSVVWEPAEERTVATRVAAQTEVDLIPLLRAQACFKYAQPARGWTDVEEAPGRTLALLRGATRSMSAFVVRHPYPCSLTELHRVIAGLARSR